jgi:hypothetical protein
LGRRQRPIPTAAELLRGTQAQVSRVKPVTQEQVTTSYDVTTKVAVRDDN